jgi:hypothetical protein
VARANLPSLDLSSPWVFVFHEATGAGLVCHRFRPQARSVISTEWLLYYHGRFGVCNPSVGHPSVHPAWPTLNLSHFPTLTATSRG